jgi:hypothetical protein
MPFTVPIVWREPKDHSSDCQSSVTKITGIASKFTHTVKYQYLLSTIRPVPHNEEVPLPKPPENLNFSDVNSNSDEDHGEQEGENVVCDLTFETSCSSSEPRLLRQRDLIDLVRDLNLPQTQVELLGCRLKGWNLLRHDTEICFFRYRQNKFKEMFSQEDDLVFCSDVCCVTEALWHEQDLSGVLFNDSLKLSLRTVLLHNGNVFPSVPLVHAVDMKESYENMKLLLWGFKVIALFLGLQLGYTKVLLLSE